MALGRGVRVRITARGSGLRLEVRIRDSVLKAMYFRITVRFRVKVS